MCDRARGSETGFLGNILWGGENCRRNPVSWTSRVAQKPGFLVTSCGKAKIVVETRFLGLRAGAQKPGFFLNLGEDAKIVAETRFLGFWLFFKG